MIGEYGKLMTINKSQGQIVSHVGMFLPKLVFSHEHFTSSFLEWLAGKD